MGRHLGVGDESLLVGSTPERSLEDFVAPEADDAVNTTVTYSERKKNKIFCQLSLIDGSFIQ